MFIKNNELTDVIRLQQVRRAIALLRRINPARDDIFSWTRIGYDGKQKNNALKRLEQHENGLGGNWEYVAIYDIADFKITKESQDIYTDDENDKMMDKITEDAMKKITSEMQMLGRHYPGRNHTIRALQPDLMVAAFRQSVWGAIGLYLPLP